MRKTFLNLIFCLAMTVSFTSCKKSLEEADSTAGKSALDQTGFSNQEMKARHFTFFVDSSDKSTQLLKKQNQDIYACRGKIGSYSKVLLNENDVICKFESRSATNFEALKAALKTPSQSFTTVSVDSSTTNTNGQLQDYVEFFFNNRKDLSIYCSKAFENSKPITLDGVKRALSGIFKLSVY